MPKTASEGKNTGGAEVWSREDSLAALASIVRASQEAMVKLSEPKNGEEPEKVFNTQAAQVATRALSEINRMLGVKAPEEQEGVVVELEGEAERYAQ